MKTALLTVITFLSASFRLSPESAPTISIADMQQNNLPVNQQIVEYTTATEIKPAKVTSASIKWWGYPEAILQTTRSGDDLLVLVNKEYKLPSTYAPSDLVLASNAGIRKGEGFYLRNILINDLRDMINAATADSIDLSMVSGYRSYNTQIGTYNYWVGINGVDGADKISARAGHSQHQLGTAIDFSSSEVADGLGGSFRYTRAATWLAENSWRYGFVISYPSGYEPVTGYSYESWHYRYIGISNAKEMHDSGMILELYLRSKN